MTSALPIGETDFFRRGNYAPVADELTEYDLPVDGAIPAELDGWYLRNGPNPRQATQHWFTGDGMIHGVRIEGGLIEDDLPVSALIVRLPSQRPPPTTGW